MHVRVRLDGGEPRRWHVRLLERLAARAEHRVSVDMRPGPGGLPRNARLLFELEAAVHRLGPLGLCAPAAPSALSAFAADGAAPDLVIDLCGDVPTGPIPVWSLAYDEVLGERGLLASLLEGHAPVATLRATAGDVIAIARLGTEYGGIARAAFEDGLARTTTLILAALAGGASTTLPTIVGETPRTAAPAGLDLGQVTRRATRMLARTIVRRLYHLCFHAPHWRTGWRKLAGPDLLDLRRHPPGGWTDLPDDGLRFYADPVPIAHAGGVTLFVEEYIHALGRGIISAVPFGPGGPIGTPEPVLDLGIHLSYPFVFESEGAVWMIPESCAAGRIDLFRATAFPRGWVHEQTLVADIVAGDATLHRAGDRWWMFATVRDEGGAFSDALHLWSAPHFRGPWTAHAKNPVLIDIASARPAGRLVERNGRLYRPVQDCRAGYGAALGLARVLRLDDEAFAQEVETVLRPGPGWPGRRLHTLNEAGGFEFIDGSGEARRSLFRRRAAKSGTLALASKATPDGRAT